MPDNILAGVLMVMWLLTQNEQRSKRGPGVADRKSLGWLVSSARERQSWGPFSPYNKSVLRKKLVPVLKVVHNVKSGRNLPLVLDLVPALALQI